MVSNADLKKQLEAFMTRIEQTIKDNHEELTKKIDGVSSRLDNFEERIDSLEEQTQNTDESVGELKAHLENSDDRTTKKFAELEKRIEELEGKLRALEDVPKEIKQLGEDLESRTNRQLRETLVFHNIPENAGGEEYSDTKKLLATTISQHCDDISYDEAFSQIKRAHRESDHRKNEDGVHDREGRRIIYAAFHSWDMCQTVIETFREKCIRDRDFKIAAEQKYGPKTNKRRKLAFQMRKQLKENGDIVSGFVAFPAKLMVNKPGDMNGNKKVYRLHTNFSRYDV